MKKSTRKVIAMGLAALLICAFCSFTALAASASDSSDTAVVTETETADRAAGNKAAAAAVCVGIAASAAAIGMGIAIAKSSEGISRQPEAAGSIRTSLMLGLVFIETAIIYARIIAILIIFVL